MHGNPSIRILALTVVLGVMALVVMSITRDPTNPPTPAIDSGAPAVKSRTPAQLMVQLSASARSLSIRSGGTRTMLVDPHQPSGTADEFRFEIPIENHATTLLLDVTWETPAPNRFLRLVLETETHPTKELTVHAPQDLESHAITFTWPPNPELDP